MSLEKILIPYLRIPKQLKELNKNIMSKLTELQDAMAEMKQVLADEAGELKSKFDELQAKIDSGISPEEADAFIADIRSSIDNIEALSEGGTSAPTPTEDETMPTDDTGAVEEPTVEEPTVEEPAVDTGEVTEPVVEEPTEDVTEPAVEEPTAPTDDTAVVEEPMVDESAGGESESEEDSGSSEPSF